jgi:hypothetical protein
MAASAVAIPAEDWRKRRRERPSFRALLRHRADQVLMIFCWRVCGGG